MHIRANYRVRTASDMARKFCIHADVVGRWMRKYGLKTPKDVINRSRALKLAGRTKVTPEQDEYIRANYLVKPQKRLADELGISHTCLITRMRQQQIEVPEEVRRKFAEKGRIKPGNVSHNKGKKQSDYMSPEAIERTKATQFKKGDLPHNCYHEVGRESLRRDKSGIVYKYICVEIGQWIPLHTRNWELANGPIPKGYCLWFKDGDTMNCELENLELITRAENLSRNSLSDKSVSTKMAMRSGGGRGIIDKEFREELLKYPDLIDLKRQQLILQRQLNKKQK